eukprot:scaffold94439_cov27-Phaeocystis_antarctica.AAC.1
MFSSVWPGPAPPRVSLSSVSLPLFRSGRGLGLCLLLPLPGDGLRVLGGRPLWGSAAHCRHRGHPPDCLQSGLLAPVRADVTRRHQPSC